MFESESSIVLPLVGSLALHAALVFHTTRLPEPSARSAHVSDAWAARSIEVGTLEETARASPQAPAPTGATNAPAAPEETAAESAEPSAPEKPRERAQAHARSAVGERAPRKARSSAATTDSRPAASAGSESPGASAVSSAASERAAGPESGSFGALGLPVGVRHFAPAFTRALSAGTYADPEWSELEPGRVGSARIEVRIDAEGHISQLELDPELQTPKLIARMLERTLILLKAGTFSLDARSVSEGALELELEVTLSQQASPNPDAAPRELFAKGHEPPRAGHPGYARFTLNSGRHVETVVRVLAER